MTGSYVLSRRARASRWRRILNALTIAAFGALFMFVTARATQAIGTPHPLGFARVTTIAINVHADLAAPAVDASAPDCDVDDAHRSSSELRSDSDDPTSPLPDLWLDEEDDEDRDDLHRPSASVFAHPSPEDTLGLLLSRAPEGSPVPNRKTPSQFLTESVRRL